MALCGCLVGYLIVIAVENMAIVDASTQSLIFIVVPPALGLLFGFSAADDKK